MSFIKSIIDIYFYKKIYNQSFKKSFLYFFLLAFVVYIIGAGIFLTKVDRVINVYGKEVVQKLPDFSVVNGELSVGNLKQPYVYADRTNAVVIDTTNSTSIENYENYQTAIILGKNMATIRSERETQRIKYSDMLKPLNVSRIDKQYLNDNLGNISTIAKKFIVIGYVLLSLFWLIGKFISVLILSLIAMAVNAVQKANLEYKYLLNISVYAITLSWVIKLIYKLLGLNLWFNFIPGTGLALFAAYWLAATIYVVLAIKGIKSVVNTNNEPNVLIQETSDSTQNE